MDKHGPNSIPFPEKSPASCKETSRGLAYLTTENDVHYLNIVQVGNYTKIEITHQTMARLIVECAERVLKVVPGTYATRINATVLASEGSIMDEY